MLRVLSATSNHGLQKFRRFLIHRLPIDGTLAHIQNIAVCYRRLVLGTEALPCKVTNDKSLLARRT